MYVQNKIRRFENKREHSEICKAIMKRHEDGKGYFVEFKEPNLSTFLC
jgi:hypothetical protein